MATLAIQAGIMVGTAVASSLLAPKPKLQAVDRGRLDDLRVQTVEEGAFKPLFYGKRMRAAGNIRWGTRTKEFRTSTPGRTGGKGGGGRQAEPPTNNYTYKKSFAILVCGNRIRRYRRIHEGLELVYNDVGSDAFDEYYEAEEAALSGTAAVSAGTEFSGGRAAALGTSGAAAFAAVRAFEPGSHTLTIFYKSSATANVTVTANGVSQTVSLPSTSGLVGWADCTVSLAFGGRNSITISTVGHGVAVSVDRVHASQDEPDTDPVATGALDPTESFPSDENNPVPFYNQLLEDDGQGSFAGSLTLGGQGQIELHTGTETQLQSPTIVAVEGAANVPAWRGESYAVFKDYMVKDGQLQPFFFDVEPYVQDLEEIMLDLYKQDGRATAAELDFSALAGIASEGFVVDRREALSQYIDALQLWYGFDVVPADGKIVAVVRGGATSHTITEDDLSAHLESEDRPAGPVKTTHADPSDLPVAVEVLYMDPSAAKDFHTGAQPAQRKVGDSFEHETLTFPIVGDADTAATVGERILDERRLAARPVELLLGPKFRHALPTDVADVVLTNKTLNVRFTSVQAMLQGLVKVRAVPERASVYTQTAVGQQNRARENPVVGTPANTLLVAADCVALRSQDVNSLVSYVAGCRRGRGAWAGYHAIKVDRNGEYERLAGTDREATIGVVETASNSSNTVGYDETREFVVKFFAGALESRSFDELLRERLNFAIYGAGNRWEVLQFASAVPETPAFPYVAQYRIKGTLTGLLGTEAEAATHQAGDYFVLVDDALFAAAMRADEVNQEVSFVGQTAGQALADAESVSAVEFTFLGNSLNTLRAINFRSRKDSDSDTLIEFDAATRVGQGLRDHRQAIVGEEELKFELELTDSSHVALADRQPLAILPGMALPMALVDRTATGAGDKVKGGMTFPASTGLKVAGSLQEMRATGNYVEAELESVFETGSGGLAWLALQSAEEDWRTSNNVLYAIALRATSADLATAYVFVNSSLGTLDPESIIPAPYAFALEDVPTKGRFRIALNSVEARFVHEHTPGKAPFYVSAVPPRFPLRGLVATSKTKVGDPSYGDAAVRGATMTCGPDLKTLFSAAQRALYYGSTSAAAYGRLYQVSAILGRGRELLVTF